MLIQETSIQPLSHKKRRIRLRDEFGIWKYLGQVVFNRIDINLWLYFFLILPLDIFNKPFIVSLIELYPPSVMFTDVDRFSLPLVAPFEWPLVSVWCWSSPFSVISVPLALWRRSIIDLPILHGILDWLGYVSLKPGEAGVTDVLSLLIGWK